MDLFGFHCVILCLFVIGVLKNIYEEVEIDNMNSCFLGRYFPRIFPTFLGNVWISEKRFFKAFLIGCVHCGALNQNIRWYKDVYRTLSNI